MPIDDAIVKAMDQGFAERHDALSKIGVQSTAGNAILVEAMRGQFSLFNNLQQALVADALLGRESPQANTITALRAGKYEPDQAAPAAAADAPPGK